MKRLLSTRGAAPWKCVPLMVEDDGMRVSFPSEVGAMGSRALCALPRGEAPGVEPKLPSTMGL